MTTLSRICRVCGQDTPFENLIKKRHCTDGVDSVCKLCEAARKKKWTEDNPDKAKNSKNDYKKRHPERVKKQSKEYYGKTKVQKNTRRRERYADNPEPELKAAKEYRKSPKGREVQRIGQKTRRARKLNAEGKYTADDVKKQYDRQRGKCYWCDKKVGDSYHIDHVIPLSRGGDNTPSNIVIACQPCNQSKSDKLPHEWHGSGGRMC